jgi:GNAT superfamily N-acetyltransferase
MAEIRMIGVESLDKVVELDNATNGSRRRDFFGKRFEAQDRHPGAFISMGASEAGELVGFVCCHLLQGEFGGEKLVAVLDAMSVVPESQGHGVGRELMQQLIADVRQRGGKELRTQAGWDQPEVLEFFASTGFRMAPGLILERSTRDVRF